MKNLYKQKRQQGFTIIEVMIVLAIAAVILLIVLLAVPALQRSSRNTQRNNDAGKLAAAVNSCLANFNGNTANCVGLGNAAVDITAGQMSQLANINFPATPAAGALDTVNVTFDYKCTAGTGGAGSTIWTNTGASSRQFIMTYMAEATNANVQRCIDG